MRQRVKDLCNTKSFISDTKGKASLEANYETLRISYSKKDNDEGAAIPIKSKVSPIKSKVSPIKSKVSPSKQPTALKPMHFNRPPNLQPLDMSAILQDISQPKSTQLKNFEALADTHMLTSRSINPRNMSELDQSNQYYKMCNKQPHAHSQSHCIPDDDEHSLIFEELKKVKVDLADLQEKTSTNEYIQKFQGKQQIAGSKISKSFVDTSRIVDNRVSSEESECQCDVAQEKKGWVPVKMGHQKRQTGY
ncbi:hypothetical protein FGO68_gene12451 [Halteria grandinella]|uniref:Uncharacterized protein n=1 Tax=Halteria grandinella TaxID=5974 RepID=A0A8J8NYL5_HALGN|nr:hypothetical protein FGO68_gene12451 [Halteria grandinella]